MAVAVTRLTRRLMGVSERLSARAFVAAGLLVLAAVVLAAYLPAFGRWFFRDDFFLLSFARYDWSLRDPLAFFQVSHNGLFTPLSNLLFWLKFQVFGFNASGYRAVSLLLHLLNAGLVGVFAWTLSRDRRAALIAAVLFAGTFAVQEAVSWIAAQVHLLSLAFFLLALIFLARWVRDHRRGDLWLALALTVPGLLIKEDTVTAPALLALFAGLAYLRKQISRKDFFLAGGLFALLGVLALGGVLLWHATMDSAVQLGQFQLGLHGIANYRYLIGLLIPPPDYIPFVSLVNRLLPPAALALYSIAGWALLLPLAAFLGWRLWKGTLLEQTAVLLILVSFAPFSMTTVGISMRYLYIPYAGFAVLLGLLAARQIARQRGTWVLALLAVFLAGNIAGTWVWNLRQGRNTEEKRAIIQTIQRDYDAGRINNKQICVYGLPRAISDVTIAVPVFTNRLPRPEVYMDAVYCPEGAFAYRYEFGRVRFENSP